MRHLLDVPSHPRRQGTVLVIVVHRREIPPRRIPTQDLHQSGFEIDAEPFPAQHEQAETRRRIACAESGTPAARRKEEREKPCLQQHPVRLIRREILQCSDAREEKKCAQPDGQLRPKVEHQQQRRDNARHDQQRESEIRRVDPEQRRRVPGALDRAELRGHTVKVIIGGENPALADQSVDLKGERVKRGEENQTERAQKKPACPEIPIS